MKTPLFNTAVLFGAAILGLIPVSPARAAYQPATNPSDKNDKNDKNDMTVSQPVATGKAILEEVKTEHSAIGIDSKHRPIPGHKRTLPDTLRLKSDEWGEFCSPWNYWSDVETPFRPLNAILTELFRPRNAGVIYLLGFGPMPKLGEWMKIKGEAIHGTRALPERKKACVLASSKDSVRYLYLIPGKPVGPAHVSFTSWPGACQAQLLGDTRNGDIVSLVIPAEALGENVRELKLSPKL